jgi:hypothetical protein
MTTQENNPNPMNVNSVEANVMTSEKQGTKSKGAAGVIFVGCLMIGLAAGLLTGQVVVGLLGGLGVGFVALGVTHAVTGAW